MKLTIEFVPLKAEEGGGVMAEETGYDAYYPWTDGTCPECKRKDARIVELSLKLAHYRNGRIYSQSDVDALIEARLRDDRERICDWIDCYMDEYNADLLIELADKVRKGEK